MCRCHIIVKDMAIVIVENNSIIYKPEFAERVRVLEERLSKEEEI